MEKSNKVQLTSTERFLGHTCAQYQDVWLCNLEQITGGLNGLRMGPYLGAAGSPRKCI